MGTTPIDQIFSSLGGIQHLLLAAAFSIARMLGLVMVFPLFTRMPLTGIVRNGVLLAFAVPIFPMVSQTLAASGLTTTLIAVYLLKEAVLGIVIAIVLGIPFWAAEGAGEVLDLQRGTTMSTLIDPMMTHETSAVGTFLVITMLVIFLAAGGLELTLDTLYASYEIWPIDRFFPVFGPETAAIFLSLLTRLTLMALTLIFPLFVTMLVSDIALAFLARAAPHFNVFALSLVVKAGVFSLVFLLYSSFLVQYLAADLGFLRGGVPLLEIIGCKNC